MNSKALAFKHATRVLKAKRTGVQCTTLAENVFLDLAKSLNVEVEITSRHKYVDYKSLVYFIK